MNIYIVNSSEINRITESNGEKALFFNPDYVYSLEHVKYAAKTALISISNGQNIAKKLTIEFLVRLSGEKQISKALKFGINNIDDKVGVLLLEGELENGIGTMAFTPNLAAIKMAYHIGDVEDISQEIYEKMALVDL